MPIKTNDNSAFWAIINMGTGTHGSILFSIHSKAWEAYFKSLFAIPKELFTSEMPLPDWPEVTLSQVKGLIHCLDSGKAPGAYLILNELFKLNQSC